MRLLFLPVIIIGMVAFLTSMPANAVAVSYCKPHTNSGPSDPLPTITCLGVGCDPNNFGTTTMDGGGQNLIACLSDGAGGFAWKGMTSSDSESSYTAYGTNDCATGWSNVYDGVAMSPIAADTVGGIVCKVGGQFGDVQPTHYWGTGSSRGSDVSCSVCARSTYTIYGAAACATGWKLAYAGYAATPMVGNGTIGSTGEIFCNQGGAFPTVLQSHYWATGSSRTTENILCGVCVK